MREYARSDGAMRTRLRFRASTNEKGELSFASQGLAEWTGLEPATPGVTGRYSNQLNYHSLSCTSVPLVGAEGLEPPTFAL
jgi:hypothetical protein